MGRLAMVPAMMLRARATAGTVMASLRLMRNCWPRSEYRRPSRNTVVGHDAGARLASRSGSSYWGRAAPASRRSDGVRNRSRMPTAES